MDNLKLTAASESSRDIGHLIMTLLEEKHPEERAIIENRVVNALREPVTSMGIKLDRLFVFIKETCEDLSAATFRELVAKIRGLCIQMAAPGDGLRDLNAPNYVSEPKWCGTQRKIGKRVRILIGLNEGKIGEVVDMKSPVISVRMAGGKVVKYLSKHLQFLDTPRDDESNEENEYANDETNDARDSLMPMANPPEQGNKSHERKSVNDVPKITKTWEKRSELIGKRVRILIGLHKGRIGSVVNQKGAFVSVQLDCGKTVNYLPKYLR